MTKRESDTASAEMQEAAAPKNGGLSPVLIATAIGVAAFSLRPALASVGALLDELRSGLGMSPTVAGVLTALPSACFALVGLIVPKLARRLGPSSVLLISMLVLSIGLIARTLVGDAVAFLVGSAVAVAGIGMGNVVMPVVVRQYFPRQIGLMTGVYSVSLTAGAALAAAVSVPVAHELGATWRSGLGIWVVPAVVATASWAFLVRRGTRRSSEPKPVLKCSRAESESLRHSPTAWALSVFFGLQAAGAYVVLGWLPQILQDSGVGADTAGLLLAITPTVGIPFALLIPSLAARLPSQRGLVVALSAVGITGYAGLWLAPSTVPWLWAALLGVAQAAFPLALTMIGLRGRTTAEVARLSAFAQGIGYLIATPCPLLVGVLYEYSNGWTAPLLFMAALLIPQTAAGMYAATRRPAPPIR